MSTFWGLHIGFNIISRNRIFKSQKTNNKFLSNFDNNCKLACLRFANQICVDDFDLTLSLNQENK